MPGLEKDPVFLFLLDFLTLSCYHINILRAPLDSRLSDLILTGVFLRKNKKNIRKFLSGSPGCFFSYVFLILFPCWKLRPGKHLLSHIPALYKGLRLHTEVRTGRPPRLPAWLTGTPRNGADSRRS